MTLGRVSAFYHWCCAQCKSLKSTGLVSREIDAPLLYVPSKDGVQPPSLGGTTVLI